MVSQGVEPVRIEIDTFATLASLRLFSKAPFDVFEDKEIQLSLKLICQAILEKKEINDNNKKTFSDFLSSFEFNCYILGKVFTDRKMLEIDIEYIEKKTATVNPTLMKFDSNVEKIQKLKDRRIELIKELKSLDEELKILETNQGVV